MKLKFKMNKPVENTKVNNDYVCLNGKKLSEQTINDYAQFIPKWDDKTTLGGDCYLVSCVQPQNHEHNDDPALGGEPSMIISKGNNRNVVVHCRNYSCPDSAILQYFLSRLTGEVKTDTTPVSAPVSAYHELTSKTFTKDDFVGNEHLPLGMSKEKQWKVHQEIVALIKKNKNQKPWKKLSEEEKSALVKEKIRGLK